MILPILPARRLTVRRTIDVGEESHVGEKSRGMPLRTQLVRFVVSGGLAAIVDFGILYLLMATGLNYVPAKACSWVAGTLTAYMINRRWTFNADKSAKRLAAVMALYGVTFVAQVGIFSVGYPYARTLLGDGLAAQAAAFVVAQGVATVINFIVQRGVIFRAR